MTKTILTAAKGLVSDKRLFRLCVYITLFAIVTIVSLALRLSSTDLQIATRFSAFGETQYYRNQWYYLLSFIVFIVLIATTHIALIAKMQQRDMQHQARLFAGVTLLLILVTALVAHAVFSVAYLS